MMEQFSWATSILYLDNGWMPRFAAQMEGRPLLLILRINLRICAKQETDNLRHNSFTLKA